MSRFLKLTNTVINTSKIIKIDRLENSYYINMGSIVNASFFSFIYNFGNINSTEWNIIIHKEHEPDDFNAVSKWIDQLKNE
jgi:hypothetical protein